MKVLWKKASEEKRVQSVRKLNNLRLFVTRSSHVIVRRIHAKRPVEETRNQLVRVNERTLKKPKVNLLQVSEESYNEDDDYCLMVDSVDTVNIYQILPSLFSSVGGHSKGIPLPQVSPFLRAKDNARCMHHLPPAY